MCVSAQADLVAGLVVGAVGIDAITHVRHRRELMLAALPLLFAAHQLVEVGVWRGLAAGAPASDPAITLYLAFAFVLPVYVPLAIMAVEGSPSRRRWMGALAVLGAGTAAILLIGLASGSQEAAIAPFHIAYAVDVPVGRLTGIGYVSATCGAAMVSGDRNIRTFGLVNLLAVTAVGGLIVGGFISLWCLWAAVTSVAIAAHLRRDVVAQPAPAA